MPDINTILSVVVLIMGGLIKMLLGKIADIEKRMMTNSLKHFEEAEKKGNRITELETYVKMLLKKL